MAMKAFPINIVNCIYTHFDIGEHKSTNILGIITRIGYNKNSICLKKGKKTYVVDCNLPLYIAEILTEKAQFSKMSNELSNVSISELILSKVTLFN